MVLYVWSGDAYVLVISMDSCILTAKPLSKVDLLWEVFCGIHLGANAQDVLINFI